VTEGRQHADRDAQFRYLNDMAVGCHTHLKTAAPIERGLDGFQLLRIGAEGTLVDQPAGTPDGTVVDVPTGALLAGGLVESGLSLRLNLGYVFAASFMSSSVALAAT